MQLLILGHIQTVPIAEFQQLIVQTSEHSVCSVVQKLNQMTSQDEVIQFWAITDGKAIAALGIPGHSIIRIKPGRLVRVVKLLRVPRLLFDSNQLRLDRWSSYSTCLIGMRTWISFKSCDDDKPQLGPLKRLPCLRLQGRHL